MVISAVRLIQFVSNLFYFQRTPTSLAECPRVAALSHPRKNDFLQDHKQPSESRVLCSVSAGQDGGRNLRIRFAQGFWICTVGGRDREIRKKDFPQAWVSREIAPRGSKEEEQRSVVSQGRKRKRRGRDRGVRHVLLDLFTMCLHHQTRGWALNLWFRMIFVLWYFFGFFQA